MVFVDGTIFASHIGHTGKTTHCFQSSCDYAYKHPDEKVLVIDFAEEGDLTKRMMGGVDASKEKVESLFGGIFNLVKAAGKKATGLTSWLWSSSSTLDITEYAVQVSQHNPNIPENLYLISSGAWPRDEQEMDVNQRKALCKNIKESLQKSTGTWKLFCDSDGDRRPSIFTKIGYGLCEYAVIPLHLNKGDLDRTETMLGVLNELRSSGEVDTKVLSVIWNFVEVRADKPSERNGFPLPFEMVKIDLEILDACNERLCGLRRSEQGLFVHEAKSDLDFLKNTVCMFRQLARNMLRQSEESGLPFCTMDRDLQAKGTQSIEYKPYGRIEKKSVEPVLTSVAELAARMSSMSV